MLKHVSVLHFFLLLKTFNCAGISHFIYPMSSWYTFRLFLFFDYYEQRCYEHSCMCTSFWVNMFSFFLNIYLRVKLLDHMVTLFNLMRVARLFYKVAVLFYISISNIWRFKSSTIWPALVIFCLWIRTILVGVKYYPIVIFICISPMINDVEHLFMWSLKNLVKVFFS